MYFFSCFKNDYSLNKTRSCIVVLAQSYSQKPAVNDVHSNHHQRHKLFLRFKTTQTFKSPPPPSPLVISNFSIFLQLVEMILYLELLQCCGTNDALPVCFALQVSVFTLTNGFLLTERWTRSLSVTAWIANANGCPCTFKVRVILLLAFSVMAGQRLIEGSLCVWVVEMKIIHMRSTWKTNRIIICIFICICF